MVTNIAMSAIVFGEKPEVIMWKVKTIVGEERRGKKTFASTRQLYAEC